MMFGNTPLAEGRVVILFELKRDLVLMKSITHVSISLFHYFNNRREKGYVNEEREETS